MNSRALAVRVLQRVLRDGKSLPDAIQLTARVGESPKNQALVQEIAYGVLRWYSKLAAVANQLLNKPLKPKDADLGLLIAVGLYQLTELRVPPHAAVSETAHAARDLHKPWAVGLVNGVLRNFLRHPDSWLERIQPDSEVGLSHPSWLYEGLREAWPEYYLRILAANNERPPFWIRVNRQRQSAQAYAVELVKYGMQSKLSPHAADAVLLPHPVPVEELPGFDEGRVSVQDAAAQLAAELLDVAPRMRILDACAAPGGKTGHILEICPAAQLVAVDINRQRLDNVHATLERLHLHAALILGDAAQPEAWWDRKPFDRILLDAPCTATGVIRRHPDIKWLRRPGDITTLMDQQGQLLETLWPLLKPDGKLVYATCSILPQENWLQVRKFLAAHASARTVPLRTAWGHVCKPGRQILPGEDSMDGFYYACLTKCIAL